MKKHILRSVSLILAAVMLMAFTPRAFPLRKRMARRA